MRYPDLAPGVRAPRHNIFLALRPPPDIAERIVHYADRLFEQRVLSGTRVTRQCLHMSLIGLGKYVVLEDGFILKIRDAVSNLRMRPFTLLLNRAMSFEHKNCAEQPFVLTSDEGVEGASQLYRRLYKAVAKGKPTSRVIPDMTPHLTLSREPRVLPEMFIEPMSWKVWEFHLIDSLIGESRHDVLGTWPLMA